jgi:hypothetical protein
MVLDKLFFFFFFFFSLVVQLDLHVGKAYLDILYFIFLVFYFFSMHDVYELLEVFHHFRVVQVFIVFVLKTLDLFIFDLGSAYRAVQKVICHLHYHASNVLIDMDQAEHEIFYY